MGFECVIIKQIKGKFQLNKTYETYFIIVKYIFDLTFKQHVFTPLSVCVADSMSPN